MNTLDQLPLKRWFLYSLIGSVTISALLGIGTILIGDFGWVELRILLTTLVISGASLCGLSCGAAIEAKRSRLLPSAGIIFSILAAFLLIIGIWGEVDAELFWKIAVSMVVFAVSTSHVSLLMLARLSPRYEWAKWAAPLSVYAVALQIVGMMWMEFDDEGAFRLLGITSIIAGAMTIVIPVLHRLSHNDMSDNPQEATLQDVEEKIRRYRRRLKKLKRLKAKLEAGEDVTSKV